MYPALLDGLETQENSLFTSDDSGGRGDAFSAGQFCSDDYTVCFILSFTEQFREQKQPNISPEPVFSVQLQSWVVAAMFCSQAIFYSNDVPVFQKVIFVVLIRRIYLNITKDLNQ